MDRKFEIETYKGGEWNARDLCEKYKQHLGKKTKKKALCVDIILVTAQEKGNLLLNMKTLI